MTKPALRLCLALFVCAVLMSGVPFAVAQTAGPMVSPATTKQSPTSSLYVALLFNKMAGTSPDFTKWAKNSDVYKRASDFEKQQIASQMISDLQSHFQLMRAQEPIYVDFEVQLMPYSTAHGGYFVDTFKDDTFFAFNYQDEHYALIPNKLMQYQLIKVSEEDAKIVDKYAPRGKVLLSMTFQPTGVDASAPLPLDTHDYWLMSGDLTDIKIYAAHDHRLLWENRAGITENETSRKILQLYR